MNKITLMFFIIICILKSVLYSTEFTLAVIPDSQNYCDYRYQKTSNPPFAINQSEIYKRQIEYIVDNSNSKGGSIYFAIHLGDNVNNFGAKKIEWEIADSVLSLLDGVLPFGIVPGNHDYDKVWNDNGQWKIKGTKNFEKYFGANSKHFKTKDWYVDSYKGGVNSCIIFDANGIKIMFLGLEVQPVLASGDYNHYESGENRQN